MSRVWCSCCNMKASYAYRRGCRCKQCKKCRQLVGRSYYARNRKRIRLQQQTFHAKNAKRINERRGAQRYGLSLLRWKTLRSGGCEVCGSKRSLCIDHCHRTKKVRGCLCATCNQALGLLHESQVLILALRSYVRRKV